MSDEWGPWIEHDGKGCPVPVGTHVYVRLRCGETYTSIAGCYFDGKDRRPHGCENIKYLSQWIATGTLFDVVSYCVRKPRGLSILREIAANPLRVLERTG